MTIVILVITLVCAGIAFRHWRSAGQKWQTQLGLSRQHALTEFVAGLAIGALVMAGIYVVFLALHLIEFTDTAVDTGALNGLTTIPLLLVLALYEEILNRSLLLNGLSILLKRPWLAVLISAALFGLQHAGNPGTTPMSVLSNGLGGVMYAVAFLETRRIWMPLALHFAWNYFQGPVFGFLVSGFNFGGLIHQTTVGDPLLTGGSYGPEGGLIAIVARLVVIALVFAWTRRYVRLPQTTNL